MCARSFAFALQSTAPPRFFGMADSCYETHPRVRGVWPDIPCHCVRNVRGECADDGAWIGTRPHRFGAHGNSTHNNGVSYRLTTAQVKASGGVEPAGPRSAETAPARGHVRDLSAFYYARCGECFVPLRPRLWLRLHGKAGLRPECRVPTRCPSPRRAGGTHHGTGWSSPIPTAFGDSHQYPSESAPVRSRRAGGR